MLPVGLICDPSTLQPTGSVATLDPAQLTRHAVLVGMTGSGKTGMAMQLLEQVVLAGTPVLAVDPKGDLGNFALVMERPEEFAPFVEGDPAPVAAAWAAGLAAEGRDPAERQRFREKVAVQVLTPGSEAGVPVDVLSMITRAPKGLAAEPDALPDYVHGVVSALLGLIGRPSSGVTNPEAILLALLFTGAFSAGEDMPLDRLIPAVVDPPFAQVGYQAVDAFLPRAQRAELARALNAVVASPSFAAWRVGVPLDIEAWMAPVDGKTPLRVVYLAHLDEGQRMFFLTLLLHAVVAWTRRQAGTAKLRALVYLDEVMGYLPPHPRDPPSKWPILTLMKQARAVGVGVMLATQNPVDMDYKAIGNAAALLIGRLITRQDKERVLEGLRAAGGDGADVADLIPRLPQRGFVVRTDRGVSVVRSRHTLSWLRGPLTRREVALLRQPWARAGGVDAMRAPPAPPEGYAARWLLPAGAQALDLAPGPVWRPGLYVRLQLRFDAGEWVDDRVVHRWMFPLDDREAPPQAVALDDAWLARQPVPGGTYTALPGWLDEAREVLARHAAWIDALVFEELGEGPNGPVVLERSDVRVLGTAVVWVSGG